MVQDRLRMTMPAIGNRNIPSPFRSIYPNLGVQVTKDRAAGAQNWLQEPQ